MVCKKEEYIIGTTLVWYCHREEIEIQSSFDIRRENEYMFHLLGRAEAGGCQTQYVVYTFFYLLCYILYVEKI